jgi:4-amino-4-deoxy-L-arabinose transferase-like glycosyltransferase
MTRSIIILLTLIGIVLHFYNLTWGAPFYFHPDERNIAMSVSQLQFPNQMNPNFFAYGSLPIYTIYFTGYVTNYFTHIITSNPDNLSPNFEQAILISRFYSALYATLLIPLLFFLGKKLKDTRTGLLTAFLATTSIGFIQFAHFGTFELWLTFFTTILFWIFLQKNSLKKYLFLGIVLGILIATKISSLILFPILFLVIPIKNHLTKKKITTIALIFFFISIIAAGIYLLTNPYVILDYSAFRHSMNYESSLVIGTLPVFYTGEFYNTIPVLFQISNSYPFLLNPLITFIFIPSYIYLAWKTIKNKNHFPLLLLSFYLILFLSQAFLFAKWTRYLMPTLPFIYLIVALVLPQMRKKIIFYTTIVLLIIMSSLFASAYFITAFVKPDTRIAASIFAKQTIPYNANIVSEVYDLGITPFNPLFQNIQLFNFYDLDNHSFESTPQILQETLTTADYLILPSQRILKTRLQHPEQFPQGNAFYKALLAGKTKYQKIYETPCEIFCQIIYLGNPTLRFEQTTNIFDHPTVMIFKRSNVGQQ